MKHIDYNNCITNLTSSIQKYFNVTPYYKTNELIDKYLQEKDYENVIVFVFDAMGNNVIDLNTTENSFLQKRGFDPLFFVMGIDKIAKNSYNNNTNQCGWKNNLMGGVK